MSTRDGLDRRAFLRRAGRLAVAAAALPAWEVAGASGASGLDPRVRTLALSVRGPVITPASPAYNRARAVYNARLLAASVRWPSCRRRASRTCGARSAGRAGTGSRSPRARAGTATPATRRPPAWSSTCGNFNAVRVPGTGLAQVGAGTPLVDLYATLAAKGLTVPGGSCPTVGVGGLAQGGGVGLASRRFGTTSDNIVSLRSSRPTAAYLTANAKQNADLYWACRGGGGGNFGVVTSLPVQDAPGVARRVLLRHVPVGRRRARRPAMAQNGLPRAPDALFSLCSLGTGGSSPVLNVFGQYLGPQAALQKLLRGLTRGVKPTSLQVGTQDYLDLQLRWAGCLGKSVVPVPGRHQTPVARLRGQVGLRRRPALVARGVHDRLLDRAPPGRVELRLRRPALDSYGGAINRVRAGRHGLRPPRTTSAPLQYVAYWDAPGGQAEGAGLDPRLLRGDAPVRLGLRLPELHRPRPRRLAPRLLRRELRASAAGEGQVDPDKLFRFPQGIPVRA